MYFKPLIINSAFRIFDTHKLGYITAEKLKMIFQSIF